MNPNIDNYQLTITNCKLKEGQRSVLERTFKLPGVRTFFQFAIANCQLLIVNVFVLSLLSCLCFTSPVLAHDLGAEVKIVKDQVVVEAYYDDGTDARNAAVKILDEASKTVAEGKTDNKGKWSFPVPKPGQYLADVNAGAGHRAKVKFTIPKVASADKTPAAEQPAVPSESTDTPDQPAPSATTDGVITATHDEIISTGPSREEFTQTPWLKLGIGIGVIGLMGLAMLAAVRLQRKNGQPGREQ